MISLLTYTPQQQQQQQLMILYLQNRQKKACYIMYDGRRRQTSNITLRWNILSGPPSLFSDPVIYCRKPQTPISPLISSLLSSIPLIPSLPPPLSPSLSIPSTAGNEQRDVSLPQLWVQMYLRALDEEIICRRRLAARLSSSSARKSILDSCLENWTGV